MTPNTDLDPAARLERYACNHPLVAVYTDPSKNGIDRLRVIQQQMLRLYATLGFMGEHADHYDVEDARAVSREVRHLKGLAELELKELRRDGPPALRRDHPMIPKLMAVTFNMIVEAIHQSLSPHMAANLEARLTEALREDPQIPWPPSPPEPSPLDPSSGAGAHR